MQQRNLPNQFGVDPLPPRLQPRGLQLRWLFTVLAILLLLMGCQRAGALGGGAAVAGANSIRTFQRVALPNSAVAQNDQPVTAHPAMDLAIASTNRLLVQGADGNLFTIAPDGTARLNLTAGAGTGAIYTQPTWSSTGERVAWTTINRRTSTLPNSLVTVMANGTGATSTSVPYPPFYLYWSPNDATLAYLSNWVDSDGQSIALRTVDVAGGGALATTHDIGQPYYFSWAPNSQQMVAHVGNRQVRLLDLTTSAAEAAEPTILIDGSANFAAPQWYGESSADGSADRSENPGQLLYVIDDENTAQLVISDASGANQAFLTALSRQDFVSFNMNSRGSHIAYIETTTLIGFNSFGPLYLYDLEEDVFEQLSTDPAIAFFWSPNGRALYFLTVESIDGRSWLRVNVWAGATVQQFERFVPSPSFLRDYLRFADQYMQSMRFWSPDSSAVVYTGQVEDGTAGVWVQSIHGDQPATLAAAGTFATWSPR